MHASAQQKTQRSIAGDAPRHEPTPSQLPPGIRRACSLLLNESPPRAKGPTPLAKPETHTPPHACARAAEAQRAILAKNKRNRGKKSCIRNPPTGHAAPKLSKRRGALTRPKLPPAPPALAPVPGPHQLVLLFLVSEMKPRKNLMGSDVQGEKGTVLAAKMSIQNHWGVRRAREGHGAVAGR
jgi:hypothetical protein